ncbi:MAG: acyl-[acyl-carrier-protein] thioesterase [Treponema sp.]
MFVDFNYQPIIEDFNKNGTLKLEAILKVLENSGNVHSDTAGDNNLVRSQNRIAWVLTDWKIQIKEYPVYNDKIVAKTWSQKVTQVFNVFRDFELYASGRIAAIGTTRWVALDLETSRLCKIEPSLIERYEPEDKAVFEDSKLEKIPVPEKFDSETLLQIRRSDIDFNDHVHNLTYIDYAMEALPNDIYAKQNFKELRITYKNPVKAGEKITAKYACLSDNHIVFVYNSDGDLKTQIMLK